MCQGGADQGQHNTLYYKGKLTGALSIPNAAGPVYTIGIMGSKPIRGVYFDTDDDGYVVSPKVRRSLMTCKRTLYDLTHLPRRGDPIRAVYPSPTLHPVRASFYVNIEPSRCV